ncbi:MAG: radical SAM protein [Deltaproteobacteria bacterium]|nr:radical SAM protein [Deltaproteobacteria bacterium]
MNKGCPNRCVFCNVQKVAGKQRISLTESAIRETVLSYIRHARREPDEVQVAFYGGSFTGLDRNDEIELLGYVKGLMDEGLVHSLRVSTRPDYIDEEQCDLLRSFGVKTVELGAQSMVDKVLELSGRGHSAADTERALKILKIRDFATGIHLMVGLPGDNRDKFTYTINRCVDLKPDTVRIHPTIVFENTALARACREGRYKPLSMTEAVDACKYALKRFSSANIPVIRLGLQTTSEMEAAGSIVAGPFHPAFHALVEESIFYDRACDLLSQRNVAGKTVTLAVSSRDISYMHGQKNGNIKKLTDRFQLNKIHVIPNAELQRGAMILI